MTHTWNRDNALPGFRCSCGMAVEILHFVESGDGQAHNIGNGDCRMAFREASAPYLIRPGTDEEESDRIEALLEDFGVDVAGVGRWWHPGWWSCGQCGSSGVTGFHACEAES